MSDKKAKKPKQTKKPGKESINKKDRAARFTWTDDDIVIIKRGKDQ